MRIDISRGYTHHCDTEDHWDVYLKKGQYLNAFFLKYFSRLRILFHRDFIRSNNPFWSRSLPHTYIHEPALFARSMFPDPNCEDHFFHSSYPNHICAFIFLLLGLFIHLFGVRAHFFMGTLSLGHSSKIDCGRVYSILHTYTFTLDNRQ